MLCKCKYEPNYICDAFRHFYFWINTSLFDFAEQDICKKRKIIFTFLMHTKTYSKKKHISNATICQCKSNISFRFDMYPLFKQKRVKKFPKR